MVTLFLCGDVMTGRGIDQVLQHPNRPWIAEPSVQDAREYVELAEKLNGTIPRRVGAAYIWGDAIAELERMSPDVRIVNLETSVTSSEDRAPKGINYRMHPANVTVLTAARIDVCVLANNHVLDYGKTGLLETLETLTRAGIKSCGAGKDVARAQRPAVVDLAAGGRTLVFALGAMSSGIDHGSGATGDRPGVALLDDISEKTAAEISARMARTRRQTDVVVTSIHWGSNWGHDVPEEHMRFARRLIDGGVDVVHGHSSHHPRPIEVYRDRLILYGCGDFIDDYEGILGYEHFRDDLVLMYFVSLKPDRALDRLSMTPLQIRNFKLNRCSLEDSWWLRESLDSVSEPFGAHVDLVKDGTLRLRWR